MSAFRDLASALSNPSTSHATAVDGLVEFIQAKRKAGNSLYDVTLQLMELMQKTPPSMDSAFDEARLLTHLPPHNDLTPDLMSRSLSRTISKAQVASVLSQLPDAVTLGNAREVVLEWALGLEGSKSTAEGKFGGKGTLAAAALADIGTKFDEIAEALGGQRQDPSGVSDSADGANAEAMALLLSVRLSLGYLDEKQLLQQLDSLSLSDGEAVLRHYIKRRLPGEGRYAMGKVLENLDSQIVTRRPALKAVIRVVKKKFLLPDHAVHRLPAPPQNKSKCISSIQSFSSSIPSGSAASDELDQTIASYTMEVMSEYVVKEKRDYMRSEKWLKTGRKSLSKDVNDIEDKLTNSGSGQQGTLRLLQTFDLLRRLHNLEPPANGSTTFTPTTIPEENEAYFPPTAQSVTSALYCYPRLDTARAINVLMELVDYEKDIRMYEVQKTKRSMTSHEMPVGLTRRESEDNMADLAWGNIEKRKMAAVLENIERRFPEGDYKEAFHIVATTTDCPPRALLDRAPSYTTVASEHTSQRTKEYLHSHPLRTSESPTQATRLTIRTNFSHDSRTHGRSQLLDRMNGIGIAEATETIAEEPPSSAMPSSFGRSGSHARTASLPGLWGDTAMCQSPPRASTVTRTTPASNVPLHSADDMVNQMGSAQVEDENLTEDQILALYSGRSPVATTPVDTGSFPFAPPASKASPPSAPSFIKKSTSRHNGLNDLPSPTLAPALPSSQSTSSSGSGLTSLFRKGSKFVRRGDHGESSRSRVLGTSPDSGLSSRTTASASADAADTTGQNPSSSRSATDVDNSRRARTHVRQAASLEPTAWRQQFLKSGMMNMPRPAPKSASHGNLA
ncbi:hypothetical protein NliqN6_4085 [Naganishia liquefaciens]|uniref:Uncharacterized protein n=1 Tax=Naganishia liquefaciens TaxID=104408 RepID=A0A8H3YFV8_9TREE|nr:hypothetical protein NliqN6_4085 [Naganishia liquefaciens]